MYSVHNHQPVPRKIESLYQGRIRQFDATSGEYRNLNLAAFYNRATASKGHIKLESYSVPQLRRPSFDEVMKEAQWQPTDVGTSYGPSWSTHWFRVHLCIPREWSRHNDRPVLYFDSSDEGLVYSEDGEPLQGLSAEHDRVEFRLSPGWEYGTWYTLYIETSCNNVSGVGAPADSNRQFMLKSAYLALPNEQARALHIDFWIIGDAAREFPESSWQKHRALTVLNEIMNTFDRNAVDQSVAACRKIATTYLGESIDHSSVYSSDLGPSNVVYAIGNCHIDTAWLWPCAETRRKTARSWATQLDLLERYPEYIFVASQAQQFAWLKNDYPSLFQRIQKAVKRGNFITIGGAWVECDANMPSGESFVRQLLLGQTFFEKNFGQRSRVFWLPDTFGYSAQLPQICRLAGMPFFLTQKLSWNNINVFPNTTFNWVGLDGSQVVCHMPPANTYTAQAHFGDVKRSLEHHKNLDVDQTSLLLFGHGDGGGGPTAEMIEKLRRCRGLADTVGLLPRVHSGATVEDFFDRVLENSDNGKDLVSWDGELYLEYHRGTYTTQAAIKEGNCECEALMYCVELFATAAAYHCFDYKYPRAQIQHLWELVCLNQFHDILPGSGIKMIYENARAIYDNVRKEAREIAEDALKNLRWITLKENLASVPRLITYSWSKVLDYSTEKKRFNLRWMDTRLIGIYDEEEGREVLAPNSVGAQLFLLEDQPMNFPAWDTEQYATEKRTNLKPQNHSQVGETVVQTYKFGNSSLQMKITALANIISFSLEVDWHETYQFLKIEFPVDVRATTATYETQFGHIQRPTHYNTSWDAAKFEVCGHRFVDLSDYSYGVTLLTKSKYGYSVHGNKICLSLLRSPKSPDAEADMGKHTISFALMPHKGSLDFRAICAAYEFCEPRFYVSKNPGINFHLIGVEPSNIFLSAVKLAEEEEVTTDQVPIIVRCYEGMGGKTKGRLKITEDVARISLVNLLEDEIETGLEKKLDLSKQVAELPFVLNAFEVRTYKVVLKR